MQGVYQSQIPVQSLQLVLNTNSVNQCNALAAQDRAWVLSNAAW